MAQLVITLADGRSVAHALGDTPLSIGRAPNNAVVLDDPSVSSHHATVTRVPQGFRLLDLGSTNGTSVNGELVTVCLLTGGEQIAFGNVAVEFVAENTPQTPPALPTTSGDNEQGRLRARIQRERIQALCTLAAFVLIASLFGLSLLSPLGLAILVVIGVWYTYPPSRISPSSVLTSRNQAALSLERDRKAPPSVQATAAAPEPSDPESSHKRKQTVKTRITFRGILASLERRITATAVLSVAAFVLLASWIYPPWIHYNRYQRRPLPKVTNGWFFLLDTTQNEPTRENIVMRIDVGRLVLFDLAILATGAVMAVAVSHNRTTRKAVAILTLAAPVGIAGWFAAIAAYGLVSARIAEYQRSNEQAQNQNVADVRLEKLWASVSGPRTGLETSEMKTVPWKTIEANPEFQALDVDGKYEIASRWQRKTLKELPEEEHAGFMEASNARLAPYLSAKAAQDAQMAKKMPFDPSIALLTPERLKNARDAGYSNDEIYVYLAGRDPRFETARKAGYTLDEVAAHLLSKQAVSPPRNTAFDPFKAGAIPLDVPEHHASAQITPKPKLDPNDFTIIDDVTAGDLTKISLFDVSKNPPSALYVTGLGGRIRNGLSRPIGRVSVKASFYKMNGEVIEVRNLEMERWRSSLQWEPRLLPDAPLIFDLSVDVRNLPQGYTYQLDVVGARYAH